MAADVFVFKPTACFWLLTIIVLLLSLVMRVIFVVNAADLSSRVRAKHNSDNDFVLQRRDSDDVRRNRPSVFDAATTSNNRDFSMLENSHRPNDIVAVTDDDFLVVANDDDDDDGGEEEDDDYVNAQHSLFSTATRGHRVADNDKSFTTSTTVLPSVFLLPKRPLNYHHAPPDDDDGNQTEILFTSSSSADDDEKEADSSLAPARGVEQHHNKPPKRLTLDVGDRDRRAKLGGSSHQERVDLNKCIVRGKREPYEIVRDFEWPRRLRVLIPGDIYIGGLHMIHEREDNCVCGPIMPQGGIQALEAMLYTLDYVNDQRVSNLLPGFRLGALILDDCDKDTYGLEQSVEFIKGSISMIGKHGSGSSNAEQQTAWASAVMPSSSAAAAVAAICNNPSTLSSMQQQVAAAGGGAGVGSGTPVISGVVGAPSSGTSKEVASLLRLFQIPQVSFFSTSPVLSNPERYKYFSRTIPSDKDQTRVMIQIIKTLGWTYISVIYEDSAYGNEAYDALEQLARAHNICIAHKDRLPKDTRLGYTKETYYNNIIEGLASKKARGVVVFGSDQEVRDLMAGIKANNLTNHFSFIGSDGWSMRPMVTVGLEDVVDGTLSVQPRAAPIPGFETYFRYLKPANNTRNPWFNEYWEHMFQCRFASSSNDDASSSSSSTSYVTPYNQAFERECTGIESYIDPATGVDRLQMEGQLQFVSDAVLAFAHAFRDLHRDLCLGTPTNGGGGGGGGGETSTAASTNAKLCTAMNPPRGEDVLYVLRHVNFTSLTGMQFYFEDPESGDPPGRYNVVQFQRQRVVKVGGVNKASQSNVVAMEFVAAASSNSNEGDEFEDNNNNVRSSSNSNDVLNSNIVSSGAADTVGVWVHVGTYGPDVAGGIGLHLDMSKVRFRGDNLVAGRSLPVVPESYCSKPCKPSQRRETKEGDVCCWVCIDCPEWAIRPRETECYTCPRGSIPFANFSYCLQVEATYIRIDSVEAIGALIFSALGVVLTTFIIVIFVMHAETPVVKASGRELTYALLAGIFLCYGMTFVLLQKPSDFVCGAQTFGIGFCFSICYAAILTKTNRIARIFRAGKRTTKRPAFISPRSQLVICLCGVLIQIVINGVWLVMDPPVATHIFPRHDLRMLVCKSHTDTSYMIAFAYPIVLLIICTVYAVLARKIPEAFNESKYIGFTMYTTCIIWLAFVPIYLSTKPNIHLRLTTLSIAISMSGTVSLACLFTPKLYIILLRPERNVRQSMMTQAQDKSRPTVSSGGQRSGTYYATAQPSNLSPPSSSIRQSSNSPQLQPLTAAAAAATAAAVTAAATATAAGGTMKNMPNNSSAAATAAVNAVVHSIAKKMTNASSTASLEMQTRLSNNKHSSFGPLSLELTSNNSGHPICLSNSIASPARLITTTTTIGSNSYQTPNNTHQTPATRENSNSSYTSNNNISNHTMRNGGSAQVKRDRKISAPAAAMTMTITANDQQRSVSIETPLLQQKSNSFAREQNSANIRYSNHDRHLHQRHEQQQHNRLPPHHHSRSHHSRHRCYNQQIERTSTYSIEEQLRLERDCVRRYNNNRHHHAPPLTVVNQHIIPPPPTSVLSSPATITSNKNRDTNSNFNKNKPNGNNQDKNTMVIYEEGFTTASNPCICAHGAPSPKRRAAAAAEQQLSTSGTWCSSAGNFEIHPTKSPPSAKIVVATRRIADAVVSNSDDEAEYLNAYEEAGDDDDDEDDEKEEYSSSDVRL